MLPELLIWGEANLTPLQKMLWECVVSEAIIKEIAWAATLQLDFGLYHIKELPIIE